MPKRTPACGSCFRLEEVPGHGRSNQPGGCLRMRRRTFAAQVSGPPTPLRDASGSEYGCDTGFFRGRKRTVRASTRAIAVALLVQVEVEADLPGATGLCSPSIHESENRSTVRSSTTSSRVEDGANSLSAACIAVHQCGHRTCVEHISWDMKAFPVD